MIMWTYSCPCAMDTRVMFLTRISKNTPKTQKIHKLKKLDISILASEGVDYILCIDYHMSCEQKTNGRSRHSGEKASDLIGKYEMYCTSSIPAGRSLSRRKCETN